jgi:hypothetical protein
MERIVRSRERQSVGGRRGVVAADLGGEPEDYDASAYFHRQAEENEGAVPDGGA